MAGSFGMEKPHGEHRYRLSFTVGGLLATQGRTLAEMYLKHVSDNGGQPDPNRENREIGEAITMIRAQAIEENVLAIRTVTASKRIVAETLKRLSVFTSEELAYLSGADAPTSDRETLMWIAMCRYYAIVGEFAFDVLKAHYLTGRISLDFEDYARFMADRATWHPEIDQLSELTAKKLRGNLFKAMSEAHLLRADAGGTRKNHNTILSCTPSRVLADMLKKRPDSFAYLPMRETSL